MSCRVKKHVYDSQTDQPTIRNASTGRVYADFESSIDDKNKHMSIMLFCLAVPALQSSRLNFEYFMHHTRKRATFFPFMDYLIQLQESVKKYLFDELPIENTPKINRDYRFTTVCPHCHSKLDNGEIAEILEGDSLDASPKVRHHAHVAGEYTTGNGEVRNFESGQYIFICCTKCNLQLSFNKKKLSSTRILSQWIAL